MSVFNIELENKSYDTIVPKVILQTAQGAHNRDDHTRQSLFIIFSKPACRFRLYSHKYYTTRMYMKHTRYGETYAL
jgi:hypothetical protein